MTNSNHSSHMNLDQFLEDFKPFFGYIASILEDYCKTINEYLSWGFLRFGIKDCYIFEDTETIDDMEGVIQCTSDDFLRFNNDMSNNLYYPIEFSSNWVSLFCVKNKKKFLSDLNLNKPEELYDEYPLLFGILSEGIKYCKKEWPIYKLSIDKSKSEMERTVSNIIYTFSRNFDDKNTTYINGFNYNLVLKFLENNNLPHLSFFHSISDFNYEGNSNNGYIEFCVDSNTITDTTFFSDNLNLGRLDSKFLRKILEMTDENNKLLVYKPHTEHLDLFRSEWDVIGLGLNNTNSIATAHFMGASKWQLYSKNELINYDGKAFTIKIRNVISDETDYDTFLEFYKTIQDWEQPYSKFLDLYRKLTKQKHGTMVVVSKKAKEEAERLCNANRGIRIEPKDLSTLEKNKLLLLSKIDGAMLIDPYCMCYALGVILDGIVEPSFEGDSGRGARYNSAKLYIHNIKTSIEMEALNVYTQEYADNAMAVVISEDGYIDVFSSIEND